MLIFLSWQALTLQDFGGDASHLSKENFRSGEEEASLHVEVGLKAWCAVKLEIRLVLRSGEVFTLFASTVS